MSIDNTTNQLLRPGLYLVGTPIGNLEDITLRALRVLSTCDVIAAEDTRRIRKLLNHFDIKVKVISYHEHNKKNAGDKILTLLNDRKAVALVTDAGMPVISDPGANLIKLCESHSHKIEIIPGPSAVATAITRAGVGGDGFLFLGFLPAKQQKRQELLIQHKHVSFPVVFYEAPHKIINCLKEILTNLGNREIHLLREMTKIHEEKISARCQDCITLLESLKEIRGEFTVIVLPGIEDVQELTEEQIIQRYEDLLSKGVHPNDAVKEISALTGLNKRALYTLLRT